MTEISLRLDLSQPFTRVALRALLDAYESSGEAPAPMPVCAEVPASSSPAEQPAAGSPSAPAGEERSPSPASPAGTCEDAGLAELEPEPDWPALVAQVVDCGARVRDVARAAGIKPQRLQGKVMAHRRAMGAFAPHRAPEPDVAESADAPEPAVDPEPVQIEAWSEQALAPYLIGDGAAEPEAAPPVEPVLDTPAPAAVQDAVEPKAGFWTPERDYELARSIIESGLPLACNRLSITREFALERWNELLPEKGLNQQRQLLIRLKTRAADAASVAA
jgi:hypothetical protein